MHRELDISVKKLKSDLDAMDFNCVDVLNKQEDEIKSLLLKSHRALTPSVYTHIDYAVSCLNEQIWAIDNLNSLLL